MIAQRAVLGEQKIFSTTALKEARTLRALDSDHRLTWPFAGPERLAADEVQIARLTLASPTRPALVSSAITRMQLHIPSDSEKNLQSIKAMGKVPPL